MIYQLPKYREDLIKEIDMHCLYSNFVNLEKVNKVRSSRVNKALHLFFSWISDNLNELGMTFKYKGLKGKILELRYTPILVKETLWRPIQMAKFGIKSTKDITSSQINDIVDTIVLFFAEQGIELHFPSNEKLMFDQLITNEKDAN